MSEQVKKINYFVGPEFGKVEVLVQDTASRPSFIDKLVQFVAWNCDFHFINEILLWNF